MTISRTVYNQLFEQAEAKEQVIRLRPTEAKAGAVVMSSSKNRIQMWTNDEHERFLEALERYPSGPWKKIADHIGTKTPRQTMTHAQKYRQKIYRRQRGLRNQRRAGASSGGAGSDCESMSPNGQELAHSRLDILAHSAVVAQSTLVPEYAVSHDAYVQQDAYGAQTLAHQQVSTAFAPTSYEMIPEMAAAHAYALRMEMARKTVSTLQPPVTVKIEPIPTAAVYAARNLCASSQLPPLSEILHLRGSQVAQQ